MKMTESEVSETYKKCSGLVDKLMQSARDSKDSDTTVRVRNGDWWGLLRAIKSNAMWAALLDVHRKANEKTLAALEKRVAEVETKGIAYRGVWQAADEYQRGNLTTYAGSMWHANTATRDKPGTSADWTLAVKGGDR